MAEGGANGFGLYIHWPFCEAKCPYCDFNSHVAARIDHEAWLQAYLLEIDRYAALLPERRLETVFLGGGTPSLMQPQVVDGILDRIRRSWPSGGDVEVTLEANPGSVEASRFRDYAAAGVNRVSIGVQALDDGDLGRLGRIHSAADAVRAVEIAAETFGRVSFDLIYARQKQTLEAWRDELSRAIGMASDHLSLYQLTVEPGTAFGRRHAAGRLAGLPADDLAADMYDATQEICAAAGFEAYEVSNHARNGGESRHNLIYWRGGDYAGIGPGAHGRITLDGIRHATEARAQPLEWLDGVARGAAETAFEPLSGQERANEYLMMGLRISEGVDLERHRGMAGRGLRDDAVAGLEEIGMVERAGGRLRATRQGRLALNSVILELLRDIPDAPETA